MRSRQEAVRRRMTAHGVLAGLGLGFGLVGCDVVPIVTFEPITDPSALYASLVLNTRAVTLNLAAPYKTFQLTATPLDVTGAPMMGLPAPTFQLAKITDSARVWVTPAGLLEARGQTPGASTVSVIAELMIEGNLRHADTVRVVVRSTAYQPPASLSIEPLDSAVVPHRTTTGATGDAIKIVGTFFLPATSPQVRTAVVRDSMGSTIAGGVIEYRSLDPEILVVGTTGSATRITTKRPGQARVVATATVYGVTLADTVLYTVTWPVTQIVRVVPTSMGRWIFEPTEIRLAPYGAVIWQSSVPGDTVDVVFDEPVVAIVPPDVICVNWIELLQIFTDSLEFGPDQHICGSGNAMMPGLPPEDLEPGPLEAPILWTSQVRQFQVPGVYPFHSTRLGVSGRIIVTADPDPTALP